MVTLDNATEAQDAQLHFASQWANPPEDVDKMVDPVVMESLKQMILHSLQIDSLEKVPFYIILVDGILLFHDNDTGAIHPRAELDTGILIYAQYDTLKQRRNERTGYATKEGIWADPPGYFDSIVWPNFVKYHKQFIQAHPQILERGANASSSSNSVNNINSHIA
ncbi:ribosylnicotinamide kinase, partial [Coemansia sp. RSA 2559]